MGPVWIVPGTVRVVRILLGDGWGAELPRIKRGRETPRIKLGVWGTAAPKDKALLRTSNAQSIPDPS